MNKGPQLNKESGISNEQIFSAKQGVKGSQMNKRSQLNKESGDSSEQRISAEQGIRSFQ